MTAAMYNGRTGHGDWIWSRGLHYGDGVFRTALIWNGAVVDLDRQIAKLVADASRLGLSASTAAFRRDAQFLARDRNRGVLKMIAWRRGQERGYRPATTATERLLLSGELPRLAAARWTRGVQAFRSSVTLSSQPLLAGIKHLGRAEQVLASADWPSGAVEAIQCDASKRPISGTRTNLFWVTNGRLYTPLLADCGVSGVMRERVLELAQRLGIPWRIARHRWQAFTDSDEAFLTNSIIGIWPLRRCERHRWRGSGPVTRALMRGLAHPLPAP